MQKNTFPAKKLHQKKQSTSIGLKINTLNKPIEIGVENSRFGTEITLKKTSAILALGSSFLI